MQTNVTSERTYSVSYFKPGTKSHYGISVAVTGDKKAKVIREAKELLLQAEANIKVGEPTNLKSDEPVQEEGE